MLQEMEFDSNGSFLVTGGSLFVSGALTRGDTEKIIMVELKLKEELLWLLEG